MNTITVPKPPRLSAYPPTLLLGLLAMWNYRKHGYSTLAVNKSTFHCYLRMREGHKGKNREKRVNQMMLFAKHYLFQKQTVNNQLI